MASYLQGTMESQFHAAALGTISCSVSITQLPHELWPLRCCATRASLARCLRSIDRMTTGANLRTLSGFRKKMVTSRKAVVATLVFELRAVSGV